MHEKLTNLLPPERAAALSRNYVLRLIVVAVALSTVLTLAAGALMIPTYVYLTESEGSKKKQLAHVESALLPAENAALAARVSALANNATTLGALSKVVGVSALIRSTLSISRAGITLSGFSYTPSADRRSGTLTISGIAATRDALRNYQIALQGAPFARSASLPVSAYAKDSDIPFTITVTVAISPQGLTL